MTRERIPDATTLQKAYGVLDANKISRTFFVKTDQEGCAIAASDLNAALGIASSSTNVEQADKRERLSVRAQPIAEVLMKRGQIDEQNETVEITTNPGEGTTTSAEEAQTTSTDVGNTKTPIGESKSSSSPTNLIEKT